MTRSSSPASGERCRPGVSGGAFKLAPEEQFADALRSAQHAIAGLELLTIEALDSPQDVAEQLWATMDSLGVVTNQAKLPAPDLDNALIGFCKAELGAKPDPADDAPDQVTFDVPGCPSAKGEALSMLGAGHSHAPESGCSLSEPPGAGRAGIQTSRDEGRRARRGSQRASAGCSVRRHELPWRHSGARPS